MATNNYVICDGYKKIYDGNKYVIYDVYEKILENNNKYINSINGNTNNISEFNFKIDDKKLNKILREIYLQEYLEFLDKKIIPFVNNDTYFGKFYAPEHEIPKPSCIKTCTKNIKLTFNFAHHSKIFSNTLKDKSSTNFSLTEMIDINKTDYAYTTLLFPNYDKDKIKKYDYLLGCILVAYMLKTRLQNYDLFINKQIGTKAKVLCMITPDVEEKIINILKKFFDDVITVPYISWDENCEGIKILDLSRGNIDPNHGYSKVATKLNIFNKSLFPYKKVIFVDSDLFPLGYYDSLFTLKTPAGVLEHRRIQKIEYGVDSWGHDRGQFISNGESIPEFLTNLTNPLASDINASLLLIEPNQDLFNEMINELQLPDEIFFSKLDEINAHKGFWLGNKFYNFYYLPEQNYLTQKFSGKWTSIDMGFSTWMVELDFCFGFTFAGFVTKPWSIQSAFQEYSINPYSLFSKINNKASNRSYGMQLFNNLLAKLIFESDFDNELLEYVKNIKILNFPIDTWEPEINLNLCKYTLLKNYDINLINKLSPDQKRLMMLLNKNNKNLYKTVYYDYLFEKITNEIYNLDFTMISYKIFNIFNKITEKLFIDHRLFPFGNTLYSLNKYESFDITDDDNDFLLILDSKKYKNKIINLVEELLNKNLQVYFNSGDMTQFTQIVSNDIKPIYYFNENNVLYITLSELIEKFDNLNIKFLNVSLYQSQISKIIENLNIHIGNNMYSTYKLNNYTKGPWIDIFFMIDTKIKHGTKVKRDIFFPARIDFKPTIDLFNFNNTTKIKVVNRMINIINYKKFNISYYNNLDRFNNYIIKSKHNGTMTRKEIIRIPETNKLDSNIILFLYETINKYVLKNYKLFDIEKYLS